MPSRDQMLSELLGGLNAPLSAFAGALSGMLQMTVGVFEALKQKQEAAN
jgi:ribosomal protein L10